jgi:glutamate dehydrogenase (NADP+)
MAAIDVKAEVDQLWADIQHRDPDQKEFLQACGEVLFSLVPLFEREPKYLKVFRRMVEPERVVHFRVSWIDDKGEIQTNRGFRIQFNQALGPYKGGCRFHPTVNLSIMKFLAFEQILKNSLTTLMMGGAKGGSDFDPKGKSDNEVMRFCQSFMIELARHIGPDRDVPAGDIGVGGREIGFMFGQYKRLTAQFQGVLTGKSPKWGGSLIRPEATGYGSVYYSQNIFAFQGETLEGKICTVSGSGNVAQYTIEKCMDLGAKCVTCSDSGGYIHEPAGFTRAQLAYIMELKNVRRGRISEYAEWSETATYHAGERPWGVKCDIAYPSATQNEILIDDAKKLVANGCRCCCEGANMPTTNEALTYMKENKVWLGVAKAANAGGVAVSGLEMAQDSQRLMWTREEVDAKLSGIMKAIFDQAIAAAERVGAPNDLQTGANVAGFLKVADSMIEQGCV